MVVSEKQSALEAGFANSLMPGGLGFLVFGLSCLTLSVSDLALLSGTGYLGACWALSGGIIVLVMNPIFLWFLPISKPRAISKSNIVFKESKSLAVLVVLVLVAAGAFGATRLKIGNNEPGSAFFFSDHPYNRAFSFFNEKFIGAYNMTIVVEGRDKGALNNAETMELIREFQTYMENETDARACISIVMMIRLLNRVYHEGNPKWALIPNDQKDLSSLGGAIKMGGTAGKWLDNTWTHGSIQAMYGDDSSQLIEERLSKARAFVLAHPSDRVDFRLFTGFLGVIDVMNHAGARAYWTSLLGSLALVFLVCLFVFQRPGSCMVMGLTMAAPLAATWTVMVFKEICISIHTAPAAPLAIGLGSALGLGLASYYQNGQSRYTKPDSQNRLGDIFRARSLAGLVLIPAVMMLPWIFIHIRFMAESAALIAVFLLAQMIVAMVILSFLADDLNLEKEA
ncbi:MAG: hypothetical protein HUK40_03280 [Desulfobacter sp.]|nr:hypothetical protein [Desulfobacter sp.]